FAVVFLRHLNRTAPPGRAAHPPETKKAGRCVRPFQFSTAALLQLPVAMLVLLAAAARAGIVAPHARHRAGRSRLLAAGFGRRLIQARILATQRDRKSTRLNSSHV